MSRLKWDEVQQLADPVAAMIQKKWPPFYEEMQGVAEGSGSSVLDIVALNIRTEIAFGQFSDGCTSLAWHTSESAFLAQNWDAKAQKENLIVLKIKQDGKPDIQMITEAGLIGKIGFNENGVGVCLNAIKAKGMDMNRLPVHLALRLALECSTASEALEKLELFGVASPAHILVADRTTAFGVECSSTTIEKLVADGRGRLIHTNHYKLQHNGVVDAQLLEDSGPRDTRMLELTDTLAKPTWSGIFQAFQDEADAPSSICRTQVGKSTLATLFNIIMDLRAGRAEICLGRPVDIEEKVSLSF
ncbi:hypothetical protein AYO21_02838 [Fonsecaea monophora]|uniref:Peptidase C45 hydrolase domain-containing protein n=1 Tax=Fonsecaea monophora TaxID=254056 RepID=A0A177FFD8_9EURO|nr:hypothetical protein AYO21_02838 [Fonsecaea monophora]OAG42887.1 hypothetical protein AYO21_02838 [Fonsecaea monophora]